jgi:hypothetical protein
MADDATPTVDYATTDALFQEALAEADVIVPGKGLVRVRALTRSEVLRLQQVKDGPERTAVIERKMVALAMLRPTMTEREVARWQQASPAGEMDVVTKRINQLSGIDDGAAKEAYREFETDPEAEFHVPAG